MAVAEAGGGRFDTVDSAADFESVLNCERTRLYNEWSTWTGSNYMGVVSEQADKSVELINNKGAFAKKGL